MHSVSLFGMALALSLMIYLTYRGASLIWAAPLCAVIIAFTSQMDVLTSILGNYMTGFVGFVKDWFPAFLLSAVFGRIMEISGGAQSITKAAIRVFGRDKVIFVSLLSGGILCYGGISGFVIIFSMYPILLGLFKEADITRRLIPATVQTGAFTFASFALPGSPAIQNLIPGDYFGTPPTSAPIIGLTAAVVMFVGPLIWLNWRANKLRAAGEGYVEPKNAPVPIADDQLPHPLLCAVPFLVILILLNIVKLHIVVCLLIATMLIVALLLIFGAVKKIRYLPDLMDIFNKGGAGAVVAVMNTAAAVGFGSVVSIAPGFSVLVDLVLKIKGNPLIAESVAVNVLAAATGSATGGLRISLDALSARLIELSISSGISLQVFHRVAVIASGALSTMPHDGAVVTILAHSKISHRKGYFDVMVSALLFPILGNIIAIILGGWGVV